MRSASTFDPALPVKVLLERFPQIQPVLAAHGIDTCCGGEHPLAKVCAAKGVPVEAVLREFERAS